MKLLSVPFVLLVLSTSLRAAWPDATSPVSLPAPATPDQIQAAYTAAVTAVVPTLGYGKDSAKALATYEATVHQAARPGAEAERLALGQAVATALQGDASPDAKAWLLKLIVFVGRAELVPAEAKLLADAEPLVRESARYALQHNPAPEAAEALRAALAKATEPAWQGALALALGGRKDAASVPQLAKLLAQKDEAAVEAALFALGNIANADAAKALSSAPKFAAQNLQIAAAESSMKCIEQMLKDGQASRALAIYREFSQPAQPRSVRLAAMAGTLKCAGDDAATPLLELLNGTEADARAVAMGFIPDLSRPALQKLGAGLGKLPPATQGAVLGLLAERGEKSARPVALEFAKSQDQAMQLAGLSALARLGDASTVPLLTGTMKTGGAPAGVARESLLALDGAGVNEAIIDAMQTENDANRRADLIAVLESRGASVATPVLLMESASDQAGVRRAAMKALGKLAAPKDLPVMLAALLKSAPGGDRDDCERAVAAICVRASDPDQQAAPVLEAYRSASATEKPILVPVLGRVGGAKAFEVVKAALASTDPATSKAGETALANWPDADETVEAELLALAQRTTAKPADRASALRAYLRVISLPSGLPDQTRLKKFQKAMELADRDQERNQVLERVAELRRIETLRFVVPYLDQPALSSRAGNTICELAKEGSLRSRNKADFEAALNKIIAVCKDTGVVDRAKRRLAGN